jgi:hypothetical protein
MYAPLRQNQSVMNKVQPVVRTGRPITRDRTQVLETALKTSSEHETRLHKALPKAVQVQIALRVIDVARSI